MSLSPKFIGYVEVDGRILSHHDCLISCCESSCSKCVKELRSVLASTFTHCFLSSHDIKLCVRKYDLCQPIKLPYYA